MPCMIIYVVGFLDTCQLFGGLLRKLYYRILFDPRTRRKFHLVLAPTSLMWFYLVFTVLFTGVLGVVVQPW